MFSGLFAQPTDIFYRAWAQTGASVAPGFNNTLSVAGAGGVTYLATSTLNSSNTHSMTLSKYSSLGALLWSAVFAVNTGGNAYAGGIALDPSGNVLITGSAYNGSTALYDLFTVKYSDAGSLLWQHLYNGGGNLYDFGTAVACASNGNVVVTGSAMQSLTNTDALTICYNSSGTVQWTQTWDNTGRFDAGGTLSLTSGLAYVTGFTEVSTGIYEYMALRYNQADGTPQGSSVTNQGGTSLDRITDVATDAAGNLYITGALGGSGQGLNIKTLKLLPNLSIAWTATWNGSANLDDAGRSVAVDAWGTVYVAGYTSATATNRDGILLRYSPSGTLAWAKTYDGAAADDEFAGLALTSFGEPFVGGHTSLHGSRDAYAALYDTDGNIKWSEAYNGPANKDDVVQQMVSDGQGNFLATGTSAGPVFSTVQTLTLKYVRHALIEPKDEAVNAPFIQDRGQTLTTDSLPTSVSGLRYYTRSMYPNVYIFDDKISYAYAHVDTSASTLDTMVRLDLTFPGAQSGRSTVGLHRQEAFHNYYLGHIPEGRERVPLDDKILIPNLYPNIDAIYGQGQDGLFIRFIGRGNFANVKMAFAGGGEPEVQTDGSLLVTTLLEDFVLPRPTAMTVSAGGVETPTEWQPEYQLNEQGQVVLSLGSYDVEETLVVKAGRERETGTEILTWWSTYYGWEGIMDMESAVDLDTEGAGFVYTCGQSGSTNFPVGSFIRTKAGFTDWTVNKFQSNGVPEWFTMIGGDRQVFGEKAYDISVGSGLFLFVGGQAVSSWEPEMLPGGSNVFNPGTDSRGAVIRLTKAGGILTWGTFFGDEGTFKEGVRAVKALDDGGVAVAGYSSVVEANIWTNHPFGSSSHQQSFGNMYIGQFNASNQLVWATKFGPVNSTNPNLSNFPGDLAEDQNGNLFVVGVVTHDGSTNDKFPTGGGTPFNSSGQPDGFLAKFNGSRTLTFSTYIGGYSEDWCTGVDYDASTGGVVATGTTKSSVAQGFPIVNSGNPALDDAELNGGIDLFIAKFSSSGTLLRSRYFGGNGSESTDIYTLGDGTGKFTPCNGVDVDPDGNIFITGTATEGLPVVWPDATKTWYFPAYKAGGDAFIAAFASNLKLEYCSYYGSSVQDNGTDVAAADLNTTLGYTVVMVGKTVNFNPDNYPTSKEHLDSYFSPTYFGDDISSFTNGIITKIYTNDVIVGTSDVNLPTSSVKMSPNPCRDVLWLDIDAEYANTQGAVFIHDPAGRLLQKVSLKQILDKHLIDVRSLPAGAYFITLSLPTGKWSGKFVKSSK